MDRSTELPDNRRMLAWRFLAAKRHLLGAAAVVLGVVAAALIFLPTLGPQLKKLADAARNNLPLSLPILMVLIAIVVRLHELVEVRGWLSLCNRFASGFVTFSIWAMVSGASVRQYIWINEQKVMDKSYAIVLVVSAFALMIACSLATVLAERPHPNPHRRLWQAFQALCLAISLIALLFPYFLFEAKADVEARTGHSLELRSFTVAIAYRDAGFNHYLGKSESPIQQCVIFRSIAAKSAPEAKAAALKSFMESDVSNQFVNPKEKAQAHGPLKVETENSWIVAEAGDESLAH